MSSRYVEQFFGSNHKCPYLVLIVLLISRLISVVEPVARRCPGRFSKIFTVVSENTEQLELLFLFFVSHHVIAKEKGILKLTRSLIESCKNRKPFGNGVMCFEK